jgi:putative aldouronate transport system permease protein
MATTTRQPATRPVWMERPSAGVQALKALALTIITVVMVYPFVYVIAVSLSSSRSVMQGGLLLFPRDITLDAYRTVLAGGVVGRSLLVSIGVTMIGTLLSVAMTVTLAYGLTRTKEVPGSKFVLYLVLLTLLFGAGIIPNYLLVKNLGMLDTYAALIVPQAISAFNLVVVRNFFMGLPAELLDSARIDGASEWRILWSIVLPLSKAVVAVIALFYGVSYWNNFFDALLYLNDTQKWPVQLVLNQYVVQGTPLAQLRNPGVVEFAPEVIKMAILVLATAPILLVYPFLQRYFTKGVLTGAVKQ